MLNLLTEFGEMNSKRLKYGPIKGVRAFWLSDTTWIKLIEVIVIKLNIGGLTLIFLWLVLRELGTD